MAQTNSTILVNKHDQELLQFSTKPDNYNEVLTISVLSADLWYHLHVLLHLPLEALLSDAPTVEGVD